MFRELKEGTTYSQTMTYLSVLTFLFGIATCFIGNIFLPLSAGFCACLFLFEDPKKRVLSYAVPAAVMLINVPINRLESIIGFEFIILAVLIAWLYTKSVTKSETAAYLTFVITFFIFISLYINGAIAAKSFDFSAIISYYAELVDKFKSSLTEFLTSTKIVGESGAVEYYMDTNQAEFLFNSLFNSILSLIMGYAFILAGFSIKVFARVTGSRCKYGILKKYVVFNPSNITSYFYIAIALMSLMMPGENIFEIAVINIANVLILPYSYVGFRHLRALATLTGRRTFFYLLIIAAVILASSAAFQLLSYLGIYFAIVQNKLTKGNGPED